MFSIIHMVHLDQIQLGYAYHRSPCEFEIQLFVIMAHHNALQVHQLAPHIYHVSFIEGDFYNDMHLIYFRAYEIFTKSNVPHWKVTCIAASFVSCGLPFANHTLNGLPALPISKPQLPCEL